MLPDIPGLGVWRLESKGWNAAAELPGTLEVLLMAASEQKFIPAVLRVEHRMKRTPGQPTKKFVVPVIDLPQVTVRQLVEGDVPLAINAPTVTPRERPALPASGASLPNDASFENDKATPEWGAAPDLPGLEDSPAGKLRALTAELTKLSEQLGKKDATLAAIAKNRDRNALTPDKHVVWLEEWVAKGRAELVERADAQEQFPTPTAPGEK
jgi:hypothetical protein